jgi:hypothetical protein
MLSPRRARNLGRYVDPPLCRPWLPSPRWSPLPCSFPSSPSNPVGSRKPHHGTCCPGTVSPHRRRDLPASSLLCGFSPNTWRWTLKPTRDLALHTLDHTRVWPRSIRWISCGLPLPYCHACMSTPWPTSEDPGGIPCAAPRHAINHVGYNRFIAACVAATSMPRAGLQPSNS